MLIFLVKELSNEAGFERINKGLLSMASLKSNEWKPLLLRVIGAACARLSGFSEVELMET